MFGSISPRLYDALYESRGRDYGAEAGALVSRLCEQFDVASGELLDVACGTGAHLSEFRRLGFEVAGVDLNPHMLEVAASRNPGVPLAVADMTDFDLGRKFDVVACLFSSIGYVRTLQGLRRATACLARHTKPGGVVLIEPWFDEESYMAGSMHSVTIDEPDLKLYRLNHSRREGDLSVVDLHYVIGTADGVSSFQEQHVMGLFTAEQHAGAMRAAGLEPAFDDGGLCGRGLHLGRMPSRSGARAAGGVSGGETGAEAARSSRTRS